eukprot:scaffold230752_cov28-Tisochrysis_lutea.AAC.1
MSACRSVSDSLVVTIHPAAGPTRAHERSAQQAARRLHRHRAAVRAFAPHKGVIQFRERMRQRYKRWGVGGPDRTER